MNSKFAIAVVLGIVAFGLGDSPVAYATSSVAACSLLTTAQVSAALGVTVDQGKNTQEPSIAPLNRLDCYWWQSGKSWIAAKRVQLELLDPADQITPVQHFNDPSLTPGMTKTPVSGVGDAAYYLAYANRIDLYVKKGSSVFYIVIGNFPDRQIDQVKTMEKTR